MLETNTNMPLPVLSPPIQTRDETGRKPWRYIRYCGFSSFISSDNDFSIFRRFDVMSNRVLLAMQDNIARLEELLNKLDVQCIERTDPELDNGSFRNDRCAERGQTVGKLQRALLEYSMSLDM